MAVEITTATAERPSYAQQRELQNGALENHRRIGALVIGILSSIFASNILPATLANFTITLVCIETLSVIGLINGTQILNQKLLETINSVVAVCLIYGSWITLTLFPAIFATVIIVSNANMYAENIEEYYRA